MKYDLIDGDDSLYLLTSSGWMINQTGQDRPSSWSSGSGLSGSFREAWLGSRLMSDMHYSALIQLADTSGYCEQLSSIFHPRSRRQREARAGHGGVSMETNDKKLIMCRNIRTLLQPELSLFVYIHGFGLCVHQSIYFMFICVIIKCHLVLFM